LRRRLEVCACAQAINAADLDRIRGLFVLARGCATDDTGEVCRRSSQHNRMTPRGHDADNTVYGSGGGVSSCVGLSHWGHASRATETLAEHLDCAGADRCTTGWTDHTQPAYETPDTSVRRLGVSSRGSVGTLLILAAVLGSLFAGSEAAPGTACLDDISVVLFQHGAMTVEHEDEVQCDHGRCNEDIDSVQCNNVGAAGPGSIEWSCGVFPGPEGTTVTNRRVVCTGAPVQLANCTSTIVEGSCYFLFDSTKKASADGIASWMGFSVVAVLLAVCTVGIVVVVCWAPWAHPEGSSCCGIYGPVWIFGWRGGGAPHAPPPPPRHLWRPRPITMQPPPHPPARYA
jgi:hypothetical protein